MTELKTTAKLVKHILAVEPKTRNSDSFLYLKVLEHVANKQGYDLHLMSVDHFFRYKADYPFFPGFETVRRTRQKVQAEFPELAACENVASMRSDNETKFREFALSGRGC